MKKFRFILLCLSALFFQGPSIFGGALHVKTTLLVEPNSISNKPFWVAVKMVAEPEWHTYWKNPGDSGMATRIKWDLPPGYTAGPIVWPTPERIDAPPLASFGYLGTTYLLVEITPPPIKNADKLLLKAAVSWLECKEACYPGKASLEKTVPINFTGAAEPDAKLVEEFRLARSQLPVLSTDWTISAHVSPTSYSFMFIPIGNVSALNKVDFFPDQVGLIDNAASPSMMETPKGMLLTISKSPLSSGDPKRLSGVLSNRDGWQPGQHWQGWQIDLPLLTGEPLVANTPKSSFLAALLLAFVGGLILNIMPCVLPVLSIKILGLAKQSNMSSIEKRVNAVFYGLGVLLTFWVLAGSIFVLKAGGHKLGWGFQLQSPTFVVVLIFLFFVMTLNLFGVFEVGTSLIGLNVSSAKGHAIWEPLSSGILAAVVATPCTAPFMGAALGFALASPPLQGLLVFTSLGVGMALPFMVLVMKPKGITLLPKPGPWMNTLKRVMGLLLLATVVWLTLVLWKEDSGRLVPVLISIPLLGVATFIYGRIGPSTPTSRKNLMLGLVVILSLSAFFIGLRKSQSSISSATLDQKEWEPFSVERVSAYRKERRPVFIDFTATWCLTCQVNQKVTLDRADVRGAFKEKNVALLKADWTNQDAVIANALEEYGRTGVPTYVLIPGDPLKPARVLPEVLTPGIVIDALKNI